MAASAAKTGGLSQSELDQLCSCEEAHGEHDEAAEPVSKALYAAKRRRRISFTGMGVEIAALEGKEAQSGGLTQAALDGLMVSADATNGRETSPVGSALRMKKRSRVSAGGAGADNMVAVASETLAEAHMMSPRKPRKQREAIENVPDQAAVSPATKLADKLSPASPLRQGKRS